MNHSYHTTTDMNSKFRRKYMLNNIIEDSMHHFIAVLCLPKTPKPSLHDHEFHNVGRMFHVFSQLYFGIQGCITYSKYDTLLGFQRSRLFFPKFH